MSKAKGKKAVAAEVVETELVAEESVLASKPKKSPAKKVIKEEEEEKPKKAVSKKKETEEEKPKKKATKDLYKVILELREELEFEANKGKVMPCGLGDLTDIMGILKLLEAGKIGQAKKSMRAMDTGAKEYIPDTCYRLMDCEDDD